MANRANEVANVIPLPTAARPSSGPGTGSTTQTAASSEARRDDLLLVERCRSGDRQAFRTLVERYQRRVYGLALGFVRDPDEARDISQEAFLKVFRHLNTFQGTSSFYTWLYRITVNLCIDLRRKAGRGNQSEFDERREHDAVGSPADDLLPNRMGFDPGRALQNSELRQRILVALDKLSESHRTVLVLREIDGLSYKEIADVLECPEGTVMSRLFHARRQMQELLSEFGSPEQKPESLKKEAAGSA